MFTVINTDMGAMSLVPQTRTEDDPMLVLMTVDLLISIRERITCQPDFTHQLSIVNDIDTVLQQIDPGARNDVDLLLGRWCAHLNQSVIIEDYRDSDSTH